EPGGPVISQACESETGSDAADLSASTASGCPQTSVHGNGASTDVMVSAYPEHPTAPVALRGRALRSEMCDIFGLLAPIPPRLVHKSEEAARGGRAGSGGCGQIRVVAGLWSDQSGDAGADGGGDLFGGCRGIKHEEAVGLSIRQREIG